jgi:hypothetical protein
MSQQEYWIAREWAIGVQTCSETIQVDRPFDNTLYASHEAAQAACLHGCTPRMMVVGPGPGVATRLISHH